MKILSVSCWILSIFLVVKSNDDYIEEFAVELYGDVFNEPIDLSALNLSIIRQVVSLGNVFHLRYEPPCTDSLCQRSLSESMLHILRRHPTVRRVEQMEDLEVEQREMEDEYVDKGQQMTERKRLRADVMKDVVELGKKKFEWSENDRPNSPDDETYNMDYKLSEEDISYLGLVAERQKRLKDIYFNDPEADHLWQYNNYGQFGGHTAGLDMNIHPIYLAGYTGHGVTVTVIDDGLDTQHIDITSNFDPSASMDINDPHSIDSNPRGPRYRRRIPLKEGYHWIYFLAHISQIHRHGTQCASVIGGVANNYFCAYGVAYNVNLGGIRMLALHMVTDLLEAYALTHNNQYISIYSNSWGPKDSGAKTAPITYYVSKGLETGASNGRNGKGSIFLFAAGNGGLTYDHCGADGLVNSPFTIAVTAINIRGLKPSYTEECSAISITAAVGGYGYYDSYDSDEIDPSLIASTVNNRCAKRFIGTSAATPMVAGCVALALEANPHLSWRDIQHLMTISARIPNTEETVWQLNTAGFLTSHRYGFGLLDCAGFVYNAQRWKSVGERRSCIGGESSVIDYLYIRRRRRTRIKFDTSACQKTRNSIDFLEHVIVHTKICHHCRGDLTIILTSPTGTKSFLLKTRRYDRNNKTISFSFLSLMNWGENPKGTWYLDIIDAGRCSSRKEYDEKTGNIGEVTLEFSGTHKSESAAFLNSQLIENYFQNIKIEKPAKSTVINKGQLYDLYNEQRRYFIQITPSKRESADLVEDARRKSQP